jgi:hypothetical protein
VLRVAILAERFSPNLQWYVDTILKLMTLAGDFVSKHIWMRVVQIVTNNDDLQVVLLHVFLHVLLLLGFLLLCYMCPHTTVCRLILLFFLGGGVGVVHIVTNNDKLQMYAAETCLRALRCETGASLCTSQWWWGGVRRLHEHSMLVIKILAVGSTKVHLLTPAARQCTSQWWCAAVI